MNNSIFKSFASNTIFVIDKKYSKSDYTNIDLSVSNESLNKINVNHPKEMEEFINEFTKMNNAKVAIGGILRFETYTREVNISMNKPTQVDERNIHLGVDIWAKEGTKSSGCIGWGNTQFQEQYKPWRLWALLLS